MFTIILALKCCVNPIQLKLSDFEVVKLVIKDHIYRTIPNREPLNLRLILNI